MPRYDLYFAPLEEGLYEGTKLFTFWYKSAIGVKGLYSLIVRFLKTLFVPKGSDPTDLSAGTNFGKLIGGNISSQEDILDLVVTFIEDAADQVKQQDRNSNREASERLKSVEILGLEPRELGFDVTVRLRNIEGTQLDVVLHEVGSV